MSNSTLIWRKDPGISMMY